MSGIRRDPDRTRHVSHDALMCASCDRAINGSNRTINGIARSSFYREWAQNAASSATTGLPTSRRKNGAKNSCEKWWINV